MLELHNLCVHTRTHGWGWLLECYRQALARAAFMFPCPGVTSVSWPHGCLKKGGVPHSPITFFSLCLVPSLSLFFSSNHSFSSGFRKRLWVVDDREMKGLLRQWEKELYGRCEHPLSCSHNVSGWCENWRCCRELCCQTDATVMWLGQTATLTQIICNLSHALNNLHSHTFYTPVFSSLWQKGSNGSPFSLRLKGLFF